jgi:hypothetical protein
MGIHNFLVGKQKMFADYWHRYGWQLIFFGSLVILFILWCIRDQMGIQSSSSIKKETLWENLLHSPELASRIPTKPVSVVKPPTTIPNISAGELECKQFLEFYFKKPFDKIRPDFLTNPITNMPLELDCYNDELKLAVEYNGAQHYHLNQKFHNGSRDRFQNQQYRDYIKKTKCKEHGIDLIIVPYTIPNNRVGEYLLNELTQRGYQAS